ncbi:MAG: carbohydrate kinase family protein [bacterium]
MALDLLATGYPSLDYIFAVSRAAGEDETAIVETLPEGPTFGGCGANVAVALARLGFKSGVAMVLGDDEMGRRYERYLGEAGVDVGNVVRRADGGTSRSHLFRNPAGGYQNFFYPGAATRWQGPLSLRGAGEARAALLTVGAPEYNRAFAREVVRQGAPLLWQLKSDVYSYPQPFVAWLAEHSRVLFMNEVEAVYLAQALEIESVAALAGRERMVVITAGEAGSTVLGAGEARRAPAVRGERVVDPTGAGDGYTAGFLAGWLRGHSPAVCGRLGATLASFVVEAVGCQTRLPTWAQLTARYQEQFAETVPTIKHEAS